MLDFTIALANSLSVFHLTLLLTLAAIGCLLLQQLLDCEPIVAIVSFPLFACAALLGYAAMDLAGAHWFSDKSTNIVVGASIGLNAMLAGLAGLVRIWRALSEDGDYDQPQAQIKRPKRVT